VHTNIDLAIHCYISAQSIPVFWPGTLWN